METGPSSADAVIADGDARLAALLRHADALPDHAVAPDFAGDRVADVLAHLHGWHLLFLGWIDDEAAGAEPGAPPPGHTWERLAELNAAILAQHSHRTYAELRELLVASHGRMVEAVRALDDDRLFDPQARPWTGGPSLGRVAHECLGDHYAWGEEALGQCAV
ncbi:ClbS/DfsB family four-helix bundle protein [Demequina sp. B12]|uniref:ClbS/DfsB family four-helix bundle protein n=1 Tax=Demequina sp. B12 TaxID=2992757 RepID=UPI00237A0FB7|nr:ClbS/DfsB family four-helix bundle protein [Demequina sp. B12]MDE0572745.1 ClbS/DfsB family four-helix bundle protein [Demequina sp. B12]